MTFPTTSSLSDPTSQDTPTWDASLPVLARLLARREELGAGAVRLTDQGVAVFHIWNRPDPSPVCGALMSLPEQITEPFPVADLLAEQVPEAEQVLSALAGTALEYTVTVRTWVQTMVPCDIPDEGHVVALRIQVNYASPSLVYIHMPLS